MGGVQSEQLTEAAVPSTQVSSVVLGTLSPGVEQQEDSPPELLPRTGSLEQKPQVDTSATADTVTYVNVDFGEDAEESPEQREDSERH